MGRRWAWTEAQSEIPTMLSSRAWVNLFAISMSGAVNSKGEVTLTHAGFAALPQHTAVRLCLTGNYTF
jgi:hypothetical protein